MNALLLPLLLFTFPLFPCWAEAPGGNSLDFLKLGASARQIGMGESGTALWDDAGSAFLNPAAVGRVTTQQAYLSYNRLFADIQHGEIGYLHPMRDFGNLSGDIQYLDYGGIPGFDATGAKTGAVSAFDRMMRLGWAPRRENLIPGFDLKIIQESLSGITATAVALDGGVLYRPIRDYETNSFWKRQMNHLSFGAAIRNMGPGAKFENETAKLPMSFSVGAAHQSCADKLNFALDMDRTVGQGIAVRFGAEGWIQNIIALRIGVRTDQDIGSAISWGVGLKVGEAELDYAMRPFGELGFVHRVGLSYRFGGGLIEEYYQQGLRQLNLGNYADAVLLFDKALALDVKNTRVVEKALEAAKALEEEQKK